MPITVTIKDETGSGRVTAAMTVDGIDQRITVRDLVRTRVREEVVRYNAQASSVFTGLVMPEGAAPGPEGFRMAAKRRIDWEKQASKAIEAFGSNGFFVLVGDRQVTDLDEVLELTADTDIRFIRLVPLAGG